MKLIRLALYGIAITLLLAMAALGLGRMLPQGEFYTYALAWRFQPTVYLIDIERDLSARVTSGSPPANAYRLPTLSPDDKQIVVTVMEQGDLYLLDIWNHTYQALLLQPAYDEQAIWSPDGRWIVYSSLLETDWDIYKIDIASSNPTQLTDFPEGATQPSWSPDSERIVFVSSQSLFVMAANCPELQGICGRNAQQLTASAGSDSFPVWSPDGTQIAFMSTRSGRAELYVMDAACLDSGEGCLQVNPRQLTTGLGRMHSLTWSAKYGLLGFITDQYGRAGLYAVQPDCGVLGGCNLVPLVIVEP